MMKQLTSLVIHFTTLSSSIIPAHAQNLTTADISYALSSQNCKVDVRFLNENDETEKDVFLMLLEKPVDSVGRSDEFGRLTGEELEKSARSKYPEAMKEFETGTYIKGLKETHSSNESGSSVRYLNFKRVNRCGWMEIGVGARETYSQGGYGRSWSTIFVHLPTGRRFELQGFGRFLNCDVAYSTDNKLFSWKDIEGPAEVVVTVDNDWSINRWTVGESFFVLEFTNDQKNSKLMMARIEKLP